MIAGSGRKNQSRPHGDAATLAADIAQRFQRARLNTTQSNWSALCPCHDDQAASLSIGWDNDKVLVHCHAQCLTGDIMRAVGLRMSDLFLDQPERRNGHKVIVATYDYTDLQGTILHQTVRYNTKDFKQRQPDATQPDGWAWNLKGVQTVLYRLPELVAAVQAGETIYLPEGEKDVDHLWRLALAATTNPQGAGKWRKHYNQWLQGAHVVILPDNDDTGRTHAEQVARHLHGIAASVKVLALPGLAEKGDVSDWLAAGGTREELERLVAATPGRKPTPAQQDAAPRRNGHTSAEAALPYSDYTNAVSFVRDHGQHLRYCYPWRSWLVWNGRCWERDTNGAVMRMAKQTIKRLARHAEDLDDKQAIAALLAHVKSSLSTAKLKAMVECVQSEPAIPVQPDELDTDPWLLNVANGTLDLRTGTLRPHRPEDLLTRCLKTSYNAAAQCSTWQAFLWHVMGGSQGEDSPDMTAALLEQRQQADDRAERLTAFLKRSSGYALTGLTKEQCVFFLHGTGSNGKSTFLEVMQAILEDYAQSTPSYSLLAKDRHDGIPNDIARLRGARLVTTVEIGEGRRLNEELVKRLTGQDTLTARFLFAEFFDFRPEFKLFIACNHLPQIKGTDHAIWRRIKTVPFTVTIADADQDKDLPEKLVAEAEGILAWLVQGCLDWQREGLGIPEEVKAATDDYKRAMDTLTAFLEECCIRHESTSVQVQATRLYRAYKDWCGEAPMTQIAFGKAMEERGFTRQRGTGHHYYWQRLGLLAQDKESYEQGA
jgi:putative DNA primase/helicase